MGEQSVNVKERNEVKNWRKQGKEMERKVKEEDEKLQSDTTLKKKRETEGN